eukprot:GEMP01006929.1.p1 GENE.GEMP01006929.1~~GEMP01006929.1.p1  ORF type:complete len:827 (+),score=110.30 GEMP01006929.1:46-2526(+)
MSSAEDPPILVTSLKSKDTYSPADEASFRPSSTASAAASIYCALALSIALPIVAYVALFTFAGRGAWVYGALWPYAYLGEYMGIALVGLLLMAFIMDVHLVKSSKIATISIGCLCFYIVAMLVIWLSRYPHSPFLAMYILTVILIMVCRTLSVKTSPSAYYRAACHVLVIASILNLAHWLCWVLAADYDNLNLWNDETFDRLRKSMRAIYEEEKVTEEDCKTDLFRSKGSCSRIQRASMMMWVGPCMMSGLLAMTAMFCFALALLRKKEENASSPLGAVTAVKVLKILALAILISVCGLWIATSIAGASMNMSSTVLQCSAVCTFVMITWVCREYSVKALVEVTQELPVYKEAMRIAQWDATRGFFVAVGGAPVFVYLLSIIIRQCLRSTTQIVPRGWRMSTITGSVRHTTEVLRHWPWTGILEWAHLWSWFYIIIAVFCQRFAQVILSYVNEVTSDLPLVSLVIIYYLVGMMMFLLPPVPGIPVYLLGGLVITNRCLLDYSDEMTGLIVGVAVASIASLFMKLCAVALQMGIGLFLGQSVYVRLLVGVHRTPIRALEKILKKPGYSIQKVAVLVGGPDWPTSVLCGILRLNVFEMMLGTLPVAFLSTPTCFSTACFVMRDPTGIWSALGTTTIAVCGFLQGMCMCFATYFLQKVTRSDREELSIPRPDHADVIKADIMHEKRKAFRKSATTFETLPFTAKFLLVLITICNALTIWGSVFMSSAFRPFLLENRISDPIDEQGLDGNLLNLINPVGYILLGMMACSLTFYGLYRYFVRIILNNALTKCAPSLPDDDVTSVSCISNSEAAPPCIPEPLVVGAALVLMG